MAYVIKCDRCSRMGPEGSNNFQPKGWTTVGTAVSVPGGCGRRNKWHQFCPECTEFLDLITEIAEETSAKKLVAILESMIEEAVDEREA